MHWLCWCTYLMMYWLCWCTYLMMYWLCWCTYMMMYWLCWCNYLKCIDCTDVLICQYTYVLMFIDSDTSSLLKCHRFVLTPSSVFQARKIKTSSIVGTWRRHKEVAYYGNKKLQCPRSRTEKLWVKQIIPQFTDYFYNKQTI